MKKINTTEPITTKSVNVASYISTQTGIECEVKLTGHGYVFLIPSTQENIDLYSRYRRGMEDEDDFEFTTNLRQHLKWHKYYRDLGYKLKAEKVE